MHAGVTSFRVRPGRMGEAVRTYVGSVIPAMRDERGFRGVLVLPPKLHNRRVQVQRLAGRRRAGRTLRAGPGTLGCRVPAREGRAGREEQG